MERGTRHFRTGAFVFISISTARPSKNSKEQSALLKRDKRHTHHINFHGVMHQGAYNHGLGFFPGDQRAGEVVIADF